MIEIYTHEWEMAAGKLTEMMGGGRMPMEALCASMIQLYGALRTVEPDRAEFAARQGEYYHLDGRLRQAGAAYRAALELEPPGTPSEAETEAMLRHCPRLLVTPLECFPLKDIAVVHHPSMPLIGYHLFWEDDYDFPDDYEPCDHEEIWVEYDPARNEATRVMTFFHSSVIESEEAVDEARGNGGRPVVRIEWGKHGSLLKGWENMTIPAKNMRMQEWMHMTYAHVKAGGREPHHPLKRYWPRGFAGTYEAYTDFSVPVDPLDLLQRKLLLFKSRWVNANLFLSAVPYNFHPKMEWPERFRDAVRQNG